MTASLSTGAYRDEQARTMTESTLRDRYIVPTAVTLGYKVEWVWHSIHSPAGVPDLKLLHYQTRRIIVAELKMVGKRPSHDQQEWLAWWRHCGAETHIWNAHSWFDGTIERVLRGEA